MAPPPHNSQLNINDLMRHVDGISVEYGIEWVVDHLVKENLTPIDLDATFEEHVGDCYEGTVTIGWIEVAVATAIKDLDPVSWRTAQADWVDAELKDGNLISFDDGATCYRPFDIEEFCRHH